MLERLDIDLYQRLKDTKVDITFGDLLKQFRSQESATADDVVYLGSTDDCDGLLFYCDECQTVITEARE